jgi:glycosyltransferase involved in cell wall biosynthesis
MSSTGLLSIVTPTYNRPEPLRRLLGSLARQSAAQIEVVIVDDGGDVSLDQVVSAFRERLAIQTLRQQRGGPAAARNLGAAASHGDRLAFLDDDCTPSPTWASTMLSALDESERESNRPALVGGRTVNALRGNLFSQSSQDIADAVSASDAPDGDFVASNNCAMSRFAFEAMGGFDPSYILAGGEDRAFCRAWLMTGGRIVRAPSALVEHHHRLDLAGFWRQHRAYGRGARRFHLRGDGKSALSLSGRLRFYMQLCTSPVMQEPNLRGLARASLAALAQFATVAGWAAEAYAATHRAARTVYVAGGPASDRPSLAQNR